MADTSVTQVPNIEDEIALEGLDGITLQGLWLRLQNRTNFHSGPDTKLDINIKHCIWSLLCENAELSFYKLPVARGDLIIHNRYELMDPDLGIVMESTPANDVNIYPFHKEENEETGEMGSCQYYKTREDITSEVVQLDLNEFEQKYPGNLVVVMASQQLREKALNIHSHVDPFSPLTLAQYCILERIGRTRTMGEVTQGRFGLSQLGDARSLFYHRKRLLKLGLITKQTHLQKGVKGAGQTGLLLHLTRFYVERKSKFMLMIEHCVELLHASPNSTLPTDRFKESMGLQEPSWRKLFKNPVFLRYIEFVSLRYTEVYPDATRKESHTKSNKERIVRCAKLVQPQLRATDIRCGRDDKPDYTDDDEDDEAVAGIMDHSKLVMYRSLLQQAFMITEQSGPDGTTQREIASKMGQTRLDSRTICRHLERCGAVGSIMRDVGRQRVTHYVARHLLPNSHLTKEFTKERTKLMQFIDTNVDEEEASRANTLATSRVADSFLGSTRTEVEASESLHQSPTVTPQECPTLPDAVPSADDTRSVVGGQQETCDDTDGSAELGDSKIATIQLDGSATIIKWLDPDKDSDVINGDGEDLSQSCSETQVHQPPSPSLQPPSPSLVSSPIPSEVGKKFSFPARSTFASLCQNAENSHLENTNSFLQYDVKTGGYQDEACDAYANISIHNAEISCQAKDIHKSPEKLVASCSDTIGAKVTIRSEQTLKHQVRINLDGGEAHTKVTTADELQIAMLNALNVIDEPDKNVDMSDVSVTSLSCSTGQEDSSFAVPDTPTGGEGGTGDISIDLIEMPQIASAAEGGSDDDDPASKFKKFMCAAKPRHGSNHRGQSHLTSRMLRRANIILQMVKQQRVVPDVFKIQKTILESEQAEDHRVDKKSVLRLLQRLRAGGLIKTIKVKFSTSEGCKENMLVLHPSVQPDDIYLASIIEQLKLRFVPPQVQKEVKHRKRISSISRISNPSFPSFAITATGEAGNILKATPSVGESLQKMDVMMQPCLQARNARDKQQESTAKPQPELHRLGPKFVRQQELHLLIFYLVRDYTGNPNLDQDEAWDVICKDNPSLEEERDPLLPTIYKAELSWRMFIPPIPLHVCSTPGWCLLCDVLLCLPLSLFCRLVRCPVTAPPGLLHYLDHPIRRFYLVKTLPASLRAVLLDSRRYVHNLMEPITGLCYMGLLQMGLQVSKERDQRFVYVNRHATLLDTTTSDPAYHQITPSRDYCATRYTFENLDVVRQYWYTLLRVCHNTKLGGNRCEQMPAQQNITVHMLSQNPLMMETLVVRQFEEAVNRDNGDTPGDCKGAAGLDSAMFAHLRRNWNYPMRHGSGRAFGLPAVFGRGAAGAGAAAARAALHKKRSDVPGTALYHSYLMSTTQQLPPNSNTRLSGMRKLVMYKNRKGEEKMMEVGISVMTREDKNRKRLLMANKIKNSRRLGLKIRRRKSTYQRHIVPRVKVPKKPYYDEADRAALRKMDKLRVDWSASEDSLLLLCKVASCYLLPTSSRSRMLPFSLVRNILHKHFPESQNKTGRACQRRMNYIMKDQTTADSVAIFVEEVRQDPYINEKFLPPGIPQNRENIDSIYGAIFVELVEHLVQKFGSNSNRSHLELPDSLAKFLEEYEVIPAKSIKPNIKYPEPKIVEDVQFHVIQTLLYSSLCCRADRESYAYQLYQAYSQFPQQALYNALEALRNSQMISYKKSYNRSSRGQSCLPLSTSPFQLSMSYIHKFVTKYQYDAFHRAWTLLKSLKSSYLNAHMSGKRPENLVHCSDLAVPLMRDKNNEGGCIAALVEQTSVKRVIMHTFLPETIIIIDTNRTITSQLPYQKSTVMRRITDLAEGSEKAQPVKMQELMTSSQDQVCETKGNSENIGKRKTLLEDTEENAPTAKRLKIDDNSSALETSQLQEDLPQNSYACPKSVSDTAASSTIVFKGNSEKASDVSSTLPTSILSSSFDDSFDMNDESFEAHNLYGAQDSNSECLKSQDTLNVNKRIQAIRSDCLERKRNVSPSRTLVSDNPLKKPRLDCSAEFREDEEESSSAAVISEVEANNGPDTDNDTETENGNAKVTPSKTNTTANSKSRHVTSASRLSVFMKDQNTTSLLENQELGSACGGGPALLQHMQDNLLLTACDVTCQLTVPPGHPPLPPPDQCKGLQPDVIEQLLLPVNRRRHAAMLSRITKRAVFSPPSLDKVVQQWQVAGCSEAVLALLRDLHAFVEGQGVAGATRADIQRWRSNSGGGAVMAVVQQMEEAGLLLREGVAKHTWLTEQHARHWLVHTHHLSRQERQSIALQDVYSMSVGETSAVFEGGEAEASSPLHPDNAGGERDGVPTDQTGDDCTQESDCNADDCDGIAADLIKASESEINETAPSAAESGEADVGDAAVTDNDVEDLPVSCSVRPRRNLALRRQGRGGAEDQPPKQRLFSYPHRPVAISLRPWFRICGTLNRRVLDRLLGTVLFLVLEQPGASGVRVAEHLAPALVPAHVHELLHLLHELGCVKRLTVSLQHAPSVLFGRSAFMQSKDDADPEVEEDDVCYVPTVDCITKLAVFIGDKKYTQDFLNGDRW